MRLFSLRHRIQTGSGAHPASYPVGTGGNSLGKRRAGREDDNSPPSGTEVKNMWSYIPLPNKFSCLPYDYFT
jgi:hypothetical protein